MTVFGAGFRVTVVFALALTIGMSFVQVRAADIPNPSVDVPPEWLTLAESSGFRKTPRHQETIDYCAKLAAHSPFVNYQTFGASAMLRELPLMILSNQKVFSPSQLSHTSRAVVMIQNGIHAGECAGKDASLMLMRDILVTGQHADLLDSLIILVMPIYNVDGHERFGPYSRINQNGPDEMGWRVTGQNLNLNRDYIKMDAIETRAALELFNQWRPDFHFDTHTTDGGDWQYDVAYAFGSELVMPQQVQAWLEETWKTTVIPGLESAGHVPVRYFGMVDSKDPTKGVRSGGFSPRFSTGYFAIRNRPSLLVETHVLKPYRTRVIGQYNILLHTLRAIAKDPDALRNAVRRADEETSANHGRPAADRPAILRVERAEGSKPFTFKGVESRVVDSEISGGKWIQYDPTKPVEIPSLWYGEEKISRTVEPPHAYIIPPEWTDAIDMVRFHGLKAYRIEDPVTIEVETYRLTKPKFATRPYESRFRVSFETSKVKETRTYRPASLVVPLDQPDAKVAIHMFEPEAPDSLVSWGFFHSIFERKEYAEHYMLEPLARKMMEENPALKAEFERRLREDQEFAANPRARLYFFYERSPYFDQMLGVYPIGRVLAPIDVRKFPV
ncbi:MAG: M14 family metallopeptidase [Planctomycetota bacterium]|jgi:hypothetical protein